MVIGCTNPAQNNRGSKKEPIDTSLTDYSQLPSSTLVRIQEKEIIKEDTLAFPISIALFLDLNFQSQLANNKLLIRKDSLFESSYVPGDSVLWLFYRYKNSEILRLGDSTLLSINIKDGELLEGFFIQIGMSYDKFKALFTDFDSLLNKGYEEGIPLVTERTGRKGYISVWIRSYNADDPVGWTIAFSNDSLCRISHSIYYEF